MRTRMIVTCLTAATALTLTLSACSSSGSTTAAAPSQSSSSAAAQPAPAGSSSAPAGTASPSGTGAPATKPVGTPGAAQQLALMGGLKQIDPNLAKDQQHALAQAQLTCAEIRSGKDEATVAKDTAANFSSGGAALSEQQGQMIAVIVKAALCP
ncbi:DUF732 domain-containing protein [Kitasatospora sp. NPDC059571]|uniref:DUF732 domain-containing protein n=1 Tax=Kitasatospora sp. NPDC059571 TaxID=3346871 RepID=UPI003679B28B